MAEIELLFILILTSDSVFLCVDAVSSLGCFLFLQHLMNKIIRTPWCRCLGNLSTSIAIIDLAEISECKIVQIVSLAVIASPKSPDRKQKGVALLLSIILRGNQLSVASMVKVSTFVDDTAPSPVCLYTFAVIESPVTVNFVKNVPLSYTVTFG